MVPGFSTTQLSIEHLKSEFRDFKLKLVNGEIRFALNENRISGEISKKVNFILNTFPSDIISGSLSLFILGLIGRKPNDIDIVISDSNRYSNYVLGTYDEEFTTPNRLGIKTFNYKHNFFSSQVAYEVDFFENKSANFLTFQYDKSTLRIQNPLEVMQHKLEIIQNKNVASRTAKKHNEDLTQIFGQSVWQLAPKGKFDI